MACTSLDLVMNYIMPFGLFLPICIAIWAGLGMIFYMLIQWARDK